MFFAHFSEIPYPGTPASLPCSGCNTEFRESEVLKHHDFVMHSFLQRCAQKLLKFTKSVSIVAIVSIQVLRVMEAFWLRKRASSRVHISGTGRMRNTEMSEVLLVHRPLKGCSHSPDPPLLIPRSRSSGNPGTRWTFNSLWGRMENTHRAWMHTGLRGCVYISGTWLCESCRWRRMEHERGTAASVCFYSCRSWDQPNLSHRLV